MESSSVRLPSKPGVDEAGRAVDQQAEAAEARLALEPGDDVVGKLHPLERLAEDELARVEDERLVAVDLDQLGQLLHRLAHVDVRIAGVVKDAELAIGAHVDARRLDQRLVERIEDDPAGLDLGANRPVGEHHRAASLFVPKLKEPRRPPDNALRDGRPPDDRPESAGDASPRQASASRAPGAARDTAALHVCPTCESTLVYPVDWAPADRRRWRVDLRCPDCEWNGGGVYAQEIVDAFDEELDRGTEELLGDLTRSSRTNMEEEVDRFIAALHAGWILPEDF